MKRGKEPKVDSLRELSFPFPKILMELVVLYQSFSSISIC